MTALEPVTGTVVPARSVRDVDAAQWDEQAARGAAIHFWLLSKRSLHTREAYGRDLRAWLAWCDEGGVPVNDARRADVDQYRDDLDGYSPATIARKLSAISSFYDYWLSENVVTRNPAHNAVRPRVSAQPSSIALSLRDASALLAWADSLADKRAGVIVRLLAETGMRVGELCSARVGDLATTDGHHVLGITRKGAEPQKLPVAAQTWKRIAAYLDGRADGWLLEVARTERRQGDGRMDRGYVRKMLRRIAREAGLPPEVVARMHPHVLRHSAATIMNADGVSLPEIQRVLGHADIRTTQRYIHLSDELEHSPVYRMAALLTPSPRPA